MIEAAETNLKKANQDLSTSSCAPDVTPAKFLVHWKIWLFFQEQLIMTMTCFGQSSITIIDTRRISLFN